jgi:hypothetical protein
VDEDDVRGDESLVLDKAAVTRQFEIGFQEVGAQFAVGDGMSTFRFQLSLLSIRTNAKLTTGSDYTDYPPIPDHHTTIGHNYNLPLRTHLAGAHIAPSLQSHRSVKGSRRCGS